MIRTVNTHTTPLFPTFGNGRSQLPQLHPNQTVKRTPCCGPCGSAWGLLTAVAGAVAGVVGATGGGPLKSVRFAGNPRLQLAAANNPTLKAGEQGTAVALVQQTLADFGYKLPVTFAKGSADGIYGQETTAAVWKFQKDQKFPPSGWDGIAGRDTLGRMDALLIAAGGGAGGGVALPYMPTAGAVPTVGAKPGERAEAMAKAVSSSKMVVPFALAKLVELEAHITVNPMFSMKTRAHFQPTLDALDRWLKVRPGDPNFAKNVTRARKLVGDNLAMVSSVGYQDATGPDCKKGGFAWATVGRPDLGVRCCDAFFSSGPNCRRDVITHEFFHLLGANHGGASRATQSTEEAFDSADDLAQMVSELFDGSSDACPAGK